MLLDGHLCQVHPGGTGQFFGREGLYDAPGFGGQGPGFNTTLFEEGYAPMHFTQKMQLAVFLACFLSMFMMFFIPCLALAFHCLFNFLVSFFQLVAWLWRGG